MPKKEYAALKPKSRSGEEFLRQHGEVWLVLNKLGNATMVRSLRSKEVKVVSQVDPLVEIIAFANKASDLMPR